MKTRHRCEAANCSTATRGGTPYCTPHWRLLPLPLRLAYVAARQGYLSCVQRGADAEEKRAVYVAAREAAVRALPTQESAA